MPNVVKGEYDLTELEEDGSLTYFDHNTNECVDSLKMDPSSELFRKIIDDHKNNESILVTITSAMDKTEVTSYRKEWYN